jgi:hypothetical protein
VGVKAVNGLPVDLTGLDPADVDAETLRIRQVVGSGIEPSLTLHFQPVSLQTKRVILIIRVPRSWVAPHGIEHNKHFLFFQRHTAGRLPMTLSQLRTTFTSSGTIVERTRKFRDDRIAWITAPSSPWPYLSNPVAVLHIVPFAGMAEMVNIDLANATAFRKLSGFPAQRDGFYNEGDLRHNLDGVVMWHTPQWHTQLFRNGSIEYATTEFFEQQTNPQHIDAWFYQINLLTVIRRFFSLQRDFHVPPPVIVMLTLLNVANFKLRTSEGHTIHGNAMSKHQIDRDHLFLPDVVFNDYDADPIAMLKPSFDCLWNAAGEQQCKFYRMNGEWKIEPDWLGMPATAQP